MEPRQMYQVQNSNNQIVGHVCGDCVCRMGPNEYVIDHDGVEVPADAFCCICGFEPKSVE